MKILNTKKQIYFLLAFLIYFPSAHTATTTVYDVVKIGELDSNQQYSPFARSINESGQVVGSSAVNGLAHAFLYENGVMTDLHSTIGTQAGTATTANIIEDDGAIIGYRTVSSVYTPYMLHNNTVTTYTPTPITIVGTLGGAESRGHSINSSGVIAGLSDLTFGHDNPVIRHPVIYSNGVITDLGMLPGYDSASLSYITHINEQNTVTGVVINYQNIPPARGYIYTESAGMVDLGALASGVPVPQNAAVAVWSINNHNQIVGQAGLDFANGGVAFYTGFIYENGQMKDLNNAITTPGWTMLVARDINDKGEIVGEAFNHAIGRGVAVLLKPRTIEVPEDEDDAILIPVKTPTGDIVIIPLQ